MNLKPVILTPNARLRIVLLGYIIRGPLGGLVWHHLQYVLGLHLMGHEVLFVEDSDDSPTCYNPETYEMTVDPTYGLHFIQKSFKPYGLADTWAYYDAHTDNWHGQTRERALAFFQSADVLINLSGVNVLRDWFLGIPLRIIVDTDPAFTQIRNLTEPDFRAASACHNLFFTFGENFGNTGCGIPDDGFPWKPTRQPIVPQVWPATSGVPAAKWTTVMQWDSYKTRTFENRFFGMKSTSFEPYKNLPARFPGMFELALGSDGAPGDALRAAGWHIADPLAVTKSPWTYQAYLGQSKGEWSVAKHGYVSSNSGWFSERSAAYLACGRPVVVQDTGFSRFLETGLGLLAFNNPEEAAAAIQEANLNYTRHCAAAWEIARTYFNAQDILSTLLGQISK